MRKGNDESGWNSTSETQAVGILFVLLHLPRPCQLSSLFSLLLLFLHPLFLVLAKNIPWLFVPTSVFFVYSFTAACDFDVSFLFFSFASKSHQIGRNTVLAGLPPLPVGSSPSPAPCPHAGWPSAYPCSAINLTTTAPPQDVLLSSPSCEERESELAAGEFRGVVGATAATEHHLLAQPASHPGASISYRDNAAVGKGAKATESTCAARARCWLALCLPVAHEADTFEGALEGAKALEAEDEDAILAATAAVSARVNVVRDLTRIEGKCCALAEKRALSSWAHDLP